jgi:hypothetical protein
VGGVEEVEESGEAEGIGWDKRLGHTTEAGVVEVIEEAASPRMEKEVEYWNVERSESSCYSKPK